MNDTIGFSKDILDSIKSEIEELERLLVEGSRYEGHRATDYRFKKDNPFLLAFEKKCRELAINLQMLGSR
jgi:hypothetical protein